MSSGKPSIEHTIEEQFVYELESSFSCLKLYNSHISWYPIQSFNVERHKLFIMCNKDEIKFKILFHLKIKLNTPSPWGIQFFQSDWCAL